LVAALLGVLPGAAASTISPMPPPASGSGCSSPGLFGAVTPELHALIGVEYADPETSQDCVLAEGGLLPADQLIITLYTPATPNGSAVDIGVEEFNWGSEQVAYPGPNNSTVYRSIPVQDNVDWSNATVSAEAGQIQQFGLNVPPVFVSPADAENLSLFILGLTLSYRIATPGTSLPIPETVGGLIGWLAVMSPVAVLAFAGGFAPGKIISDRLRYVSTSMYAALLALFVTLVDVLSIAGNFVGFLYWLGQTGVSGLALVLLVPLAFWGMAVEMLRRSRRQKYRIARAPIAMAGPKGEPTAEIIPLKIYGGGDTGHPEELVEGLGVGGFSGAWHRLLGARVYWNPTLLTDNPRFIRHEYRHGRLPIEGEYALWPGKGGTSIQSRVTKPATVFFPWRKSVAQRFEEANGSEPNGHAAAPGAPIPAPAAATAKAKPKVSFDEWAHKGAIVGVRHGEAELAALGSPDHVGPDQYIRGVATAGGYGKESQRLRNSLVELHARFDAESWEKAAMIRSVEDRMEFFGGSPEAMEGVRQLTTKRLDGEFDPEELMNRLAEEGRRRVDYRPPGSTHYSFKSETSQEVRDEAVNPEPPDSRKKGR
jgi:hypothetical protein